MRRPTDQVGGSRGFRQFILKIHGRCDLACDHCYVYTMADQRWQLRPRMMSSNTMDQVAARIAEHVRAHRPGSVEVVLHGGEPLLAGPQRLAHCVRGLRAAVGSDAEVQVRMQTNGLRLDADLLPLLDELRIQVGVSLDGDQAAHDRHRKRPDGTGSYSLVANALRTLGEHRELFGGLLCTIDLRNDPVRTYENLLEFAPPAVDFLLPNGNWSSPPPGRQRSAETPYADWLIAVFDRWYRAAEQETHVRLFAEILNVLFGGMSTVEGIGLSPTAMVVVETDGAIEASDMLTGVYEGAAETGLNVARDPFDAALRHPVFQAAEPARECLECSLHRVCGGGLHAHRYRAGSPGGGFANPSVYCADLFRLISHIRDSVARDLIPLQRNFS
ncbi:FxsB family radical SAM/SPASM domain protein [Saccharopolyspora sp. K220]|uniref:FxsB family cyclophane-forming radical SAM/SPASM peptide maturase n=1 Tax=Saccharopolyspora soli TaxID=2926618 RepID=UPI001F55AA7B|nr:FxsB family cyclophane-forming radical SAM/SPASM peptide maturase [Saccharopolyspora soli]MCI2418133.1 FxsB family radical SAM/SPASM domain protein [Saccharopolyspora soli]